MNPIFVTKHQIRVPPCIHADGQSLCYNCREEAEADPYAYIDYGYHPEGLARWNQLQAEIAAAAEERDAAQARLNHLEATGELPY